ncbi:hypothetical protein QYE76_024351 [Lolium multiflorum]|uniref:Transposase (putative) gypsy type domain-containing protein n=1 Tax=Lolium multiflorum TaxID=4521 RepID=A0AAD8REW9_LOLMU|nr:hypothetical protein QYE76_024351 [Lolium multiflorum]
MAAEDLEWERSKISNQDMNLLKKLGFTKKENALRFPKEESYPSPPIEYRVSFVDHLIRGLSPPIHEFLRGLLFVYGLQLHQLTPNSILHMSIFITLCECFLGVQPNWALWKRIFCLRRNGSHNVAYNIGGVVTPLQARKNPLWKYAGEKDINRLSKDLPLKDYEKLIRRISSLSKKDTIPSSCRITPYSGANPLPENHPVLASLPPLPEGGEVEDRTVVDDNNQGTSRPESEVAGSHKSAASSEKEAESEATASTHSLPPPLFLQGTRGKGMKSKIPAPPKSKKLVLPIERRPKTMMPSSALVTRKKRNLLTRLLERPLIKEFIRFGIQFVGYRDHANKAEENLAEANKRADAFAQKLEQSEKARRTHQEYELECPEGDELIDALSLLEIHGDEARDGLADAEAGLPRLLPYFFPKKEEPNTYTALAKSFNVPEDLGLKLRQEGLKIGVEGTIALIADSQQNVDWAKVGDIKEMETKKWQSLIRAAKPPSKPILAFLGVKPTPAPSASKPEVK